MKASKLSVIILSFFVIFMLIPMNQVSIPMVSASYLPTDQDSWTENSTGTWTFHTSYVDTQSWTSTDVQEGSLALNVTHTKASTSMYIRLVFASAIDVSGYDGLFFWLKATSPDSAYTVKILMNPTDTNWDTTNTVEIQPTDMAGAPQAQNATWQKIFIPMLLFDASGTGSLSTVRQIYFIFLALGSADNSTMLIDKLHFTDFEVTGQTPTTDQLKMMALTYYNFELGQFTETIGGTAFTSMYENMNLTDNSLEDSGLEIEVCAQSLFALSMAYEETKYPYYLTEAEALAQIVMEAQESVGLGAGGLHNYWTGSVWVKNMGTVFSGWGLAGLSHLYGQTSNTTYLTACNSLRDFLTGIMWNSTNNVFNSGFDNVTQTVTYSSTYGAMRDGSGTFGLATYYRYVSANSTVLSTLNSALNKILTQTTPYVQTNCYDSGKWEDTSYQMWGMWQAYQATSNTTYKESFLNTSKVVIGSYMKNPSLNGSASRHVGQPYTWSTTGNYLDGWGLHNILPLFYLANELEAQSYFINALELSLFNHLRLSQTSEGALQRDSSTWDDLQYFGTPSFLLLAFEFYLASKGTDLYVSASTGKVTSITETSIDLTIAIEGTGTTTTNVYCGSKGQPLSVDGADSWSYNSRVLTFTVTHASSKNIKVSWEGQASGKFQLDVHVKKDGLPVQLVNVTVRGQGSDSTDLLGVAEFELDSGSYFVEVTVDGETQNKTVNVHTDVSVGFEFSTVLPPAPQLSELTVLIAGIAGLFIFYFFFLPMFWRRK